MKKSSVYRMQRFLYFQILCYVLERWIRTQHPLLFGKKIELVQKFTTVQSFGHNWWQTVSQQERARKTWSTTQLHFKWKRHQKSGQWSICLRMKGTDEDPSYFPGCNSTSESKPPCTFCCLIWGAQLWPKDGFFFLVCSCSNCLYCHINHNSCRGSWVHHNAELWQNRRGVDGIRVEYFPSIHHIAALQQSPRVHVKHERSTRRI